MSTMAQTQEQIDALQAAGIHVVVSDAQDIAGVYEAIALVGDVTGKQEEAEALVEEMQQAFADISSGGRRWKQDGLL